ncbi:ribonuclease P protein component [Candidatus Epulonipiscium viviparus]|uniref:ribonuclease P protein component n=1 Tax=Candidatus Epulonipiscium viviparus TaxID=420336 RepID=UPI00016BFDEA|nr:ribonuclease P protein component [Candidatus Epulopiscium viviparus]
MKTTEKLRKNTEFKKVYAKGKSYANKELVLYKFKNNVQCNRLGISVSKKVGNSVTRSRVTRLIRENFRLNEENLVLVGFDIVIIAREASSTKNFYEIKNSLYKLLKRQGLL